MMKSALFFLLFASLLKEYRSDGNSKNDKLSKVINNLSTVARLINGISVQSEFMRSSQNLNTVVGELLGIGDSIPELLKVKVKDLMKDVDGVMEAVKNVSVTSSQNLGAIGDVMNVMKKMDVENVKKAMETNVTVLKKKWEDATSVLANLRELRTMGFLSAADSLKYILANPMPSNPMDRALFVDKLRNFGDKADTIITMVLAIENKALDNFWALLDSKPEFDSITIISQVAQEYSFKANTFSSLANALTDMKVFLTTLEPVIKKSQTSSTSNQTLGAMTLLSSDKVDDKKLTAGFHNGISDLKMLFDDLNGKWLKENVADGKDMKMMVTALEPLKKFYENLKPLETSWGKLREDPQTGRNVGNIATIIMNGKLLNASDLTIQISVASKCITGLTHVPFSTDFIEFKAFHAGLEKLDVEITKLRDAIMNFRNSPLTEKMKQSTNQKFIVRAGELTETEIAAALKTISDYDDIKPISQLMSDYLESLKNVDFEMIMKMVTQSSLAFDIRTNLAQSRLIPSIECLNNEKFDYAGTAGFTKFQQSFEVIKAQNDTSGSMKSFIGAVEALKSLEKKLKKTVDGMKVSRRRRKRSAEDKLVKGLLKLADSGKVAQELGNGVQVLREMSEVFENRDKVLKVATSVDSVDTVIQGIPEMAGKWTVDNKKALEKLVDEVNTLNGNMGTNKSLKGIWTVFGTAQSVNGAPIEGKLLGTVVFGVLNGSANANVTAAAADFQNFPPLQLDFTGAKRSKLSGASKLLDPITSFFKDFFGIDTSTPPPPDPPDYAGIFGGIGGSLLIIGLLVGGGILYRKRRLRKRRHDRERALIYIKFKKPDEMFVTEYVLDFDNCQSMGMIAAGAYMNQYIRPPGGTYTTPMHIALEHLDPRLLKFLLENGGDPKMENFEKMTVMESFCVMCKEDEKRGDYNEDKLKRKKMFLDALVTYAKLQPYERPKLMKPKLFSFMIPEGKCQDFCTIYPTVINRGPFDVFATTHVLMEVDKKGVAHCESHDFFYFFKAVFSPAVLVGLDYISVCVQDNFKFHMDYDMRVTKVAIGKKVYKNLDLIKEFSRGRRMPFGAGLCLYLLVEDPEIRPIVDNLGFTVLDSLKQPSTKAASFYRSEMKNLIVYDEKARTENAAVIDKVNRQFFDVMSIEEFAVYLLEMKITGLDGGDKINKIRWDKKEKVYRRKEKIELAEKKKIEEAELKIKRAKEKEREADEKSRRRRRNR